jgi:hypothetical protein
MWRHTLFQYIWTHALDTPVALGLRLSPCTIPITTLCQCRGNKLTCFIDSALQATRRLRHASLWPVLLMQTVRVQHEASMRGGHLCSMKQASNPPVQHVHASWRPIGSEKGLQGWLGGRWRHRYLSAESKGRSTQRGTCRIGHFAQREGSGGSSVSNDYSG